MDNDMEHPFKRQKTSHEIDDFTSRIQSSLGGTTSDFTNHEQANMDATWGTFPPYEGGMLTDYVPGTDFAEMFDQSWNDQSGWAQLDVWDGWSLFALDGEDAGMANTNVTSHESSFVQNETDLLWSDWLVGNSTAASGTLSTPRATTFDPLPEFYSIEPDTIETPTDQQSAISPLAAEDFRVVASGPVNPFMNSLTKRQKRRKRAHPPMVNGVVNGYIKIRLSCSREFDKSEVGIDRYRGNHHNQSSIGQQLLLNLPPGFGSQMRLDATDRKLWIFYTTAMCRGKSLFKEKNPWLVEIGPLADADAMVRHCVLALSSTYAVDYNPSLLLEERCIFHQRTAIRMLTEKMSTSTFKSPAETDAICVALLLLSYEDIVTWESNDADDLDQSWTRGIQLARQVLKQSDPGLLYNKVANVQNSNLHTSASSFIASFSIASECFSQFSTDSEYRWLLHGTEKENSEIHAGTGVSPKLLHVFGQITQLAIRMEKKPDCIILPMAMRRLQRILSKLRQWSVLSTGYPSTAALIDSCILDGDGLVFCPVKVTDLTAAAWLEAAHIYLHCRFYRRPRCFPDVQQHLHLLLRCVERMPANGSLFTSQSPLLAIFIMGLVSVNDQDRRVAINWFETVTGDQARSSVPPVWEAMRKTWEWFEADLIEEDSVFEKPIAQRCPWWEEVARRLTLSFGMLPLI